MRKFLYFFFIVCMSLSCKRREEAPAFVPSTELFTAHSTDEKQAEVRGALTELTRNNAKEFGVVWAETPSPDITSNKKPSLSVSEQKTFSLQLNNLELGKTYYVRAYVQVNNEYYYSNEVSFEHKGPFLIGRNNNTLFHAQKKQYH